MAPGRIFWSGEEISLLIAVMEEKNILDLIASKKMRRKEIFKIVEKEFLVQGFSGKNYMQIETKWKNLKKEYIAVKKQNNQNGKGKVSCEYYNDMDKLLGTGSAYILKDQSESESPGYQCQSPTTPLKNKYKYSLNMNDTTRNKKNSVGTLIITDQALSPNNQSQSQSENQPHSPVQHFQSIPDHFQYESLISPPPPLEDSNDNYAYMPTIKRSRQNSNSLSYSLQDLIKIILQKKDENSQLKYLAMYTNLDTLLQKLPESKVDELNVEFMSRALEEIKKNN